MPSRDSETSGLHCPVASPLLGVERDPFRINITHRPLCSLNAYLPIPGLGYVQGYTGDVFRLFQLHQQAASILSAVSLCLCILPAGIEHRLGQWFQGRKGSAGQGLQVRQTGTSTAAGRGPAQHGLCVRREHAPGTGVGRSAGRHVPRGCAHRGFPQWRWHVVHTRLLHPVHRDESVAVGQIYRRVPAQRKQRGMAVLPVASGFNVEWALTASTKHPSRCSLLFEDRLSMSKRRRQRSRGRQRGQAGSRSNRVARPSPRAAARGDVTPYTGSTPNQSTGPLPRQDAPTIPEVAVAVAEPPVKSPASFPAAAWKEQYGYVGRDLKLMSVTSAVLFAAIVVASFYLR